MNRNLGNEWRWAAEGRKKILRQHFRRNGRSKKWWMSTIWTTSPMSATPRKRRIHWRGIRRRRAKRRPSPTRWSTESKPERPPHPPDRMMDSYSIVNDGGETNADVSQSVVPAADPAPQSLRNDTKSTKTGRRN